jgi:hypothetical protein
MEDRSKDTWQNVELALPYLREAHALGLPLVAVSKWHHLRAVYCLRTQLPEAVPLYAIGWEPSYGGRAVIRETWPQVPDGRRRVIRETSEVARRIADGSYTRPSNGTAHGGDTEEVPSGRAALHRPHVPSWPGLASGWSPDIATRTAG